MQFLHCFWILILFQVAFCHRSDTNAEIGVNKLEEVFSWNQITYNIEGNKKLLNRYGGPIPQSSGHGESVLFPEDDKIDTHDDKKSDELKPNNEFIQYNNIPMGVDRWKDKIFISVPRRRVGIPSTLNYVSLIHDKDNKSPGLRPYPDFKTNDLASENPLVSVYRTRVDVCDRIWMVDTGITETQDQRKIMQRPAIVIFNLKTNELFKRYELRDEDYKCSDHSGFISITVDVNKNDCDNAYAYLPDLTNSALVVYSLKKNTSWKLKHNYFHLEPDHGDMKIGGIPFQWDDGIFSVALGPVDSDGYRDAYFHAMISNKVRSINTAILKNETLATRSYHGNDFKTLGNRGINGQCTIHSVHQETGTMVFAQIAKNALTCWNMKKPLSENTLGIIAQDDAKFIYPSDMKVEHNNIWIMSNKLPLFLYSKLNSNETNFRVYRTSIQNAVANTVCST